MWRALLPLLLVSLPCIAAEPVVSRLPFGNGSRFTIAQGYDASRAHDTPDRRWVVGFQLPLSTSITAVAAGRVIEAPRAGQAVSGLANVIVEHADGTSAYYIGLPVAGVQVNVGDSVTAGEQLALSGNYLHFARATRGAQGAVSLPLVFANGVTQNQRMEARSGTNGVAVYAVVAPRARVATAPPVPRRPPTPVVIAKSQPTLPDIPVARAVPLTPAMEQHVFKPKPLAELPVLAWEKELTPEATGNTVELPPVQTAGTATMVERLTGALWTLGKVLLFLLLVIFLFGLRPRRRAAMARAAGSDKVTRNGHPEGAHRSLLERFVDVVRALVDGIRERLRASLPVTPPAPPPPRFNPTQIMTETEMEFLRDMEQAVPELRISPQMAMGALLQPKRGDMAGWNAIGPLRADFVVSLRDREHTVIAVVELDDARHDNDKRRASDAARDRRLADAGYTVIRWRCEREKGRPNVATIRAILTDPALVEAAKVRVEQHSKRSDT